MSRELIGGVILTVLVAVVGIWLLALAGAGRLPTGFGLFDMGSDLVRAIVFIVLLVLVWVLWRAFTRREETR